MYIYGKNVVYETLRAQGESVHEVLLVDFGSVRTDKHEYADIITLAKRAKIPLRYIGKRDVSELVGEARYGRVIASVGEFSYTTLPECIDTLSQSERALVLVLDGVEDPRNLGAIVRTASAAGVSCIVVPQDRQASVTPVVYSTSAGTVASMPIVRVPNIKHALKKLQDVGFWIYGVTFSDESVSVYDTELDAKTVLVLGAEGAGMSRTVAGACDALVHIPMRESVESLNVSVATALATYRWVQQYGISGQSEVQ